MPTAGWRGHVEGFARSYCVPPEYESSTNKRRLLNLAESGHDVRSQSSSIGEHGDRATCLGQKSTATRAHDEFAKQLTFPCHRCIVPLGLADAWGTLTAAASVHLTSTSDSVEGVPEEKQSTRRALMCNIDRRVLVPFVKCPRPALRSAHHFSMSLLQVNRRHLRQEQAGHSTQRGILGVMFLARNFPCAHLNAPSMTRASEELTCRCITRKTEGPLQLGFGWCPAEFHLGYSGLSWRSHAAATAATSTNRNFEGREIAKN